MAIIYANYCTFLRSNLVKGLRRQAISKAIQLSLIFKITTMVQDANSTVLVIRIHSRLKNKKQPFSFLLYMPGMVLPTTRVWYPFTLY